MASINRFFYRENVRDFLLQFHLLNALNYQHYYLRMAL